MSGSALTRSRHSSSSCLWRKEKFFVMMIIVSLIPSLVLVSCNTLSQVTSSSSSSGSNAVPEALTADPHAGTQSDTPSHEKAATKDPRIISKGEARTYHVGDTAVLECVVEDLGDHAKIWRIGRSHLLFAGPQVIFKNPRISQTGEDRKLEIRDLTLNDTNEYVCQVAARVGAEIRYEVRVLPAPPENRDSGTPTKGHAKHPHAKNHSPSSLNPSSAGHAAVSVTGIALLSLFFNNYFVRQA